MEVLMSGVPGALTIGGILLAATLPLTSFIEDDKQQITNYSVTYAKQDLYDIPKEEYVEPPQKLGDPYLNSLAESLGVVIPVFYGTCNVGDVPADQILGCYYPNTDKIIITQYANAWGEEHIKCVIVHESRHHYQDVKGLMKVEKGVIMNRDFLELDAYNYAGC